MWARMPGASSMICTVPAGANCASSTVAAPSGNSKTSRFSTGMREHAIRVRAMTAAAIRLAALKKSRPRPIGVNRWANRLALWASTASTPSVTSRRLFALAQLARRVP
ncbi:hypothetical protein D3C85_1403290 [compost metagenome]